MNKYIFICTLLNISFCFSALALPEGSIDNEKVSVSEFVENNNNNEPLTRVKRRYDDRYWTPRQVVEAILCVFLPPVAVLLHGGPDMLLHLIINIVLWICGWIPGAIHAFWYCFYRY
ncbi:unnamed protein product [Meloidogyne enterolobii]|uniref:Uncharacterized protein n=1 Tax=Meloidogyne enterolobii TaxID=390850 RepID=A0ACB0ZYE2_MELEN